jgi:hypothetical protein
MRGKKVLVLLVPVLVLSMLQVVPAAIARGPDQAVEVGNNPNLSAPRGSPILDTPSGVHNVWSVSTETFSHWIDASKGEGKKNNAVIVGPTADVTLGYLLTHLSDYENTWIYFTQIGFKAFLIYGNGFTEKEAEDEASLYPDGIYWLFVQHSP